MALEAVKNQKTLAELSQHFEVNPVTISKWKTELYFPVKTKKETPKIVPETENTLDSETETNPSEI